MSTIETVLVENRVFPPPAALAAGARVGSMPVSYTHLTLPTKA